MKRHDDRMVLRCWGPLTLVDEHGHDRTPRNAKTCGLLALLALADGHRRSRRWIESRLWSDRGQAQASGSLRQALSELRRCLGPAREALVTDRWVIALDATRIALSMDPLEGHELFEGLDVRDPEFEHWLSLERQNRADAVGRPSRIAVLPTADALSVTIVQDDGESSQIAGFQIAQNLAEIGGIDLRMGRQHESHLSDLTLSLGTRRYSDAEFIAMQLRAHDGRILWSASHAAQGGSLGEVMGLANEATDAILSQARLLDRLPPEARTRELALDEALSFDAARLRVADGLLAAALDSSRPDPALLAWRAVVRLIMINERTESDLKTLTAEAQAFSRRALQAGRDNPTVAALLSQVDLFLGAEIDDVAALVKVAASRNASAVFAQTSLAAMALRAGKVAQGVALADGAVLTAGRGRLSHWSHMVACIARITERNFEQAAHHARTATTLAPAFQMPARHLYALDLNAGRTASARSLLGDLQRRTPDFSLAMIRETPEFPAATLRASGLAAAADVTLAQDPNE